MGASTKGAIITDKKDFWVLSQRIGHAIYTLVVDHYEAAPLDERIQNTAAFALPHLEMNGSFHSPDMADTGDFCFFFRHNGEDRVLKVHTNSDCDLRDPFGEGSWGIILIFDHRGSSIELMEAILSQIQDLGECFIDENDDDTEGYRPIKTQH